MNSNKTKLKFKWIQIKMNSNQVNWNNWNGPPEQNCAAGNQ